MEAETLSIGRDPVSDLLLDDGFVSRRHCVIHREGEDFSLVDLDSRNGTFLNGIPVKSRRLQHGDQIRVGGCTFLVLLDETAPPDEMPSESRLDHSTLLTYSPSALTPPDGVEKPEVTSEPRTLRDFKALLKVSAAVGNVQGLDLLQRVLLESIFEVVPADRGAIILAAQNLGEFTSIYGWDRLEGTARPIEVSREAVWEALRKRTAIIRGMDRKAPEGGAPALPAVSSLLVVPLALPGEGRGVIYLDSSNPQVRFDERHLDVVRAIAGMGSIALENARRVQYLEAETKRLQSELERGQDMVGESQRMKELYRFIARVAPTDSTVLITGESGTGKELVARAIHRNSPRAPKPFVAINCAALTETLLESELFGHEKGAFTGAWTTKKGKIEVAEGGTVFLDEVGELAISLQAKLLRVLQERELERVGGTRPIKVDFRLVAATNRNLADAAGANTFRKDLYYRLNVVSFTTPPLRERREDISLLATYFAARHSEREKRPMKGVSPEARACLLNYDWPGNVRELENAIERAVVMGSGEAILPEDLPESVLEASPPTSESTARYQETIRETKRGMILAALAETDGNYTEAAKLLGVRPTSLHRLMHNLQLKSKRQG
jgi:transcriptional regulator with GAF, ATPase, and Fis domain